MKNLLISLLAFAAIALPLTASADPGNPLPENVGLYNFSTISVTSTPVKILSRNSKRGLLIIANSGATNPVTIKPGTATGSATDGIVLDKGALFMPTPPMVDAWWAESASGTTVTVIEGVK